MTCCGKNRHLGTVNNKFRVCITLGEKIKCKHQGKKGSLFTFPFPGIWLNRLNTCVKRVLQGHPRTQIVHGCLGDCTPLLVRWLVASSSLVRLAARSRAFTCRCCHGKGHLEKIQATLKGKSEDERWKIEAWFKETFEWIKSPPSW